MAKVLKTTIKLRRDTLINYAKCGSHVPLVGEVCLVDTLSRGLRMKVGDGVTSFINLPYLDEDNPSVVLGYLYLGKFYRDSQHTKEITEFGTNVIYIDVLTDVIYYFDGTDLKASKVNIPSASETEPGIMKLYSSLGYNTDGTMSQDAITHAIGEIKFDIEQSESGDDNYLVLNNPVKD